MNPITIICPNCEKKISLDDASAVQVEEKVRNEFNKKWIDEKKKLQEKAELEKIELRESIKKELVVEVSKREDFLKQEIEEKNKKIDGMLTNELKMRQDMNRFEDDKKSWELDKQKQLDEDREKIRREAAAKALEENHNQLMQKDKQISGMLKTIEELKAKGTQGSQQLQGEVMEIEIEEMLSREFPFDQIIPVPKGVRGADVIQKVHNSSGKHCGTIVWESKRTKDWKESWVQKLKDDMRSEKGDMAVLISNVLPQDVKYFSYREGIFVGGFDCLLNLAQLLRVNLIEYQKIKNNAVGKNEKMESLYEYITSNEFQQRVEAMIETFNSMKSTLDKERKVMMGIWGEREKQIEKVINYTSMMHGSLSGIVGASLPEIKEFEIASFLEEPLFEEVKSVES